MPSRPDSRSTSPAEDALQQLQLENQLLAERAEEIFLLGHITAEVTAARNLHDLLAKGLEQIAILRTIPFAAYGSWVPDGLELDFGFVLQGENMEGGRITLDPDLRQEARHNQVLLGPGDMGRIGLPPQVQGLFQPLAVTLIPSSGSRERPGCFVFAGECEPREQEDASQLLSRAVEILGFRMDNLDALAKLEAMNRSLDAKVAERTRMLEQSQRMEVLGRLAGGIAHDFNNILMIVTGRSEMALGALDPGSPGYEDIMAIQEAGRRGGRLTRQLLGFSRRQAQDRCPLDLNGAIADLAKVFHGVIGEKFELVQELDMGIGPILADQGHLEQVLMNLLLNARDAMPSGGRIRMATHHGCGLDPFFPDENAEHAYTGRYIALEVEDEGEGIPDELREKIFDPFFTTKAPGEGTGLGLAMVFSICRSHDAVIQVDQSETGGALFRICFPELKVQVAQQSRTATLPRGQGQRVLLVEDDAAIREVLGKLVGRLGYVATACGNGQEALGILQEKGMGFDLMISDVVMPVMGGGELVRRARAMRPAMKILFLSGYTDAQIEGGGGGEGADGFLQKPVTMQELAEALHRMLG